MRTSLLLAALAAFLPSLAQAACSEDADALAKKYGITASLPHANSTASAEATSETLAKTGGVIAPPATGDMQSDSQAAVPDPEPMKTAPDIAPQTADGKTDGKKTARVEGTAATDSQAASLLQAAREAGMKGDEASCTQRLADARALLEKSSTTSQ